MSGASSVAVWKDVQERGSRWGMFLTAVVYRWTGRWLTEPLLWLIVLYFLLRDTHTRRASRKYLQKVWRSVQRDSSPGWADVFRHYLMFARTSLDRFDVWSERLSNYTFSTHGREHLDRLLELGRGAVFIGAHLGNFDMLRSLAGQEGALIHILTDRKNSRKFSGILKRFCPRMEQGVIEVDPGDIEVVFGLEKAIQRGEFIGLLGDRIAAAGPRGSARVSAVPFLGEPALISHAPFLFASHLKCPVFLLFAMRRAPRNYELYVEPFAEQIDLSSADREMSLTRYAGAYAARLEHYCRENPFQWFNFYDFWRQPS